MSERPLRVTFYSYKGGVGRTLALLNVAAVLARAKRRVVAVDLDLEAPGFGLSSATARPSGAVGGALGVSDLLLDRLARPSGNQLKLRDCVYPIPARDCEDRLWLMPVGRMAAQLSRRLPGIYADPAGDEANLFQLLVAEIEDELKPDYLLFDSRTGRADVAGVCTVELPQVLVAACGLNDQNIRGMERTLEALHVHPARVEPVATVLVLSPVPRAEDLGVQSVATLVKELPPRSNVAAMLTPLRRSNPLLDRLWHAQAHLMPRVRQGFYAAKEYYPGAGKEDLLHALPYDPMVPLVDELALSGDESWPLSRELQDGYRRLARSLTRFHPHDEALEDARALPAPVWLEDWR